MNESDEKLSTTTSTSTDITNPIAEEMTEKEACPSGSSEYTRLCTKAKEHFQKSKYKKALECYNRALAIDMGQGSNRLHIVYANRAATYLALHNYTRALHDAEKAIELRPMWPKGHFRKGEVEVERRQFEQALVEYRMCLTLDITDASKDIVNCRIVQAELLKEAEDKGIYFRQLVPGRDICLQSFNPITKIIYEIARQMRNIIYVIGDVQSKECYIVDICWDVDGVMKLVKKDGMRLMGCIITHNHFDHVGGRPPPPFDGYGVKVPGIAKLMRKVPNVPVFIHQYDADMFQLDSEVDPARICPTVDGQTLKIGRFDIEFIHTPGHTPGSQCILFAKNRLLTGDTLFPSSCGRMDLPGGDQASMFQSLQRILAGLDDRMGVFPAHCYFGKYMTTIGNEKKYGLLKPIRPEVWFDRMSG